MAGKSSRVPAGAKRPADRAPAKRARFERVIVPMDPEAVEALNEARYALEQERDRLADGRDTRVARAMLARREQAPHGDPWGAVLDAVRAEVDVAIADELAVLEKAVQQALEHVDATSRTYEFRAIGNVAFQRLLGEHKPTDEDHEQVKADGQGARALFHPDTFGPALVAASGVGLDDDEVEAMWAGGDWNFAELAQLWQAAYAVNTQPTVVVR